MTDEERLAQKFKKTSDYVLPDQEWVQTLDAQRPSTMVIEDGKVVKWGDFEPKKPELQEDL